MTLMSAALLAMASVGAAPAQAQAVQAGLQSADAAVRARAVEAVLARPESVDPFEYALVVKALWQGGRRRQAAFWFYVFQERTRPWGLADRRGDGAAALRSALDEELGTVVNGWIGSDPAAWRALVEPALAYEKRFPLCRERAPGIDAARWAELVNRSRIEYDQEARAEFAAMRPAEFAAGRRKAGLYVGALQDPGPDLPQAWR